MAPDLIFSNLSVLLGLNYDNHQLIRKSEKLLFIHYM